MRHCVVVGEGGCIVVSLDIVSVDTVMTASIVVSAVIGRVSSGARTTIAAVYINTRHSTPSLYQHSLQRLSCVRVCARDTSCLRARVHICMSACIHACIHARHSREVFTRGIHTWTA